MNTRGRPYKNMTVNLGFSSVLSSYSLSDSGQQRYGSKQDFNFNFYFFLTLNVPLSLTKSLNSYLVEPSGVVFTDLNNI